MQMIAGPSRASRHFDVALGGAAVGAALPRPARYAAANYASRPEWSLSNLHYKGFLALCRASSSDVAGAKCVQYLFLHISH